MEDAVDFIYGKVGAKKPPKASLLELIDSPVVTGYINDADTVNALHYVRILGMNAKHGRSVRKKEAKLAFDNMSYLIGLISSKENGTESAYRKPPYMSEAATRRLYIDLYLKEAGWDVLDVENLAQPAKAGIEIEVQGMPNAHGVGYCDYVLYGKDGKPLAIIEVKKTSVDPEKGRHQVDLYGECMKKVYGYKPVLYYTNGYSTKIIDGIYPDRPVMAFHTMEDLELMLQRRTRGDITDLTINDEITNRPYQKMAITNICEWLNAKHRRGLLVMATGTGKTRVAISLVDVLTRNNWVKNVLFLADRTSLVNQAKRNFAKLMPNMSVCELSAGGEKDFNARLMFCTYQTMINYIDAEDKRFSSGRFDLIIIDEAHRSIFNRYGTIFKYFDSFLVGLTATPKNEVDANTCQLVDYSVNYGDDLVLKFEEDDEFRIAVSVDMLDTGVDVPAVLNLVFFKKVRSKIKFVQMIGRGTRLCENIYGPGKNKSGFQIFDYCGNFEYFGEHPDGKDGKEMLTLSQRLFQIRLDMLLELQKLEYQEDAWFHAYYDQIKTELHGMVVKIKSHSNRIQVREAMQYVDKYYNLDTWVSLSPVMVKEAKVHISPLLDSGLNGDHLSVAFDVRMYHIEKALLAGTGIQSVSDHVKNIRLIAQYLLTEKASVPQILKKASELKVVMSEVFWTTATVQDLEKYRSSLRDLMQFLDGSRKKKFDIDITDEVDEAEYQPEDTMIDIRTYREKVIDYLAEHLDSAVIKKIHNLEPITNADLAELEHILWHELGTKAEYDEATDIGNLAAFVRSLIGLSQEAVNVKFGEYLSGNRLNSQQQEFVRTIINYVRENGDVELADMVNTEPFNNYDLNEIFGVNLPAMIAVVQTLHGAVQAA